MTDSELAEGSGIANPATLSRIETLLQVLDEERVDLTRDQDALIGQLLEHYEKLDEDLRAELPLKRVGMLASQDDADDD